MKTLIVVRHAKSSWDDREIPDIDRPLNGRGKRDAPRMAKRLKEKEVTIDIVVTSPAVRTVATCDIFVDTLSLPKKSVELVRELYHAGDEVILGVIRRFNDKNGVAMLFGHNPGLTDFVNNLLEEEIDNIPTTGIVCCRLMIEKWSDAIWGCGKMEFFDYPKKGSEG